MATLDAAIVEAMPNRERALWEGVFWGGTFQSIIGYGRIAQPRALGEEREWFLIGLARQKRYYSIYVNAVHDGLYLSRLYADRLSGVELGSACIRFRRHDDLDLGVLAEMLRKADEITPADR